MRAFLFLCVLGGVGVVLAAPRAGADEPKTSGRKVFREEVRPLIESKCLSCHGGERKRGGLDLKRRAGPLTGGENGPAIIPGSAAKSLLYRRLTDHEMPPQNPLSEEQVAA